MDKNMGNENRDGNDIQVFYEATPNPLSLKFVATKPISATTLQVNSPGEAHPSPLAQKIFRFPWTQSVFIGPNFVTVTRHDWVEWEVLADPLCELIQEHIASGEPVFIDSRGEDPTTQAARDRSNDSPLVQNIIQVIDEEIRPMVAMDGGDITFVKYEDQKVYVSLSGACSGCPSSLYTLKDGVESRLRSQFPEVLEVIAEL